MLTIKDKNIIKSFFNDNGYVLDFTDDTFDSFTVQSIGVAIKLDYGLSKAKSLSKFIEEGNESQILKLTKDLLDYYDELPNTTKWRTSENDKQAKKIRKILDSNQIESNNLHYEMEELKQIFNNEYIEKQMELMRKSIETHPADSIGKSKELLESCFKFILDSENIEYKNSVKLQDLRQKVFILLNLESNKNNAANTDQEVKKILSSLTQVVDGINNLRNREGDGHGKGKGFMELPPRYARLVVNSSIAMVRFVWDTYNEE
ncbi:abortive infection family protein [Vagococcus carniphilus]|uniref:abortive infection family protein n=1 Tax=Vagococcus carniphilus TaxID=218144 RepID=UPI00288F6FA7|nr:abortive infection family protein [Vagococcus carniphilus]MDT2814781.1 abortive infection family protein [Vagococcus carniphilus]MDT2864820.1 abortive infection family protein [Vagococcus carniphilus]